MGIIHGGMAFKYSHGESNIFPRKFRIFTNDNIGKLLYGENIKHKGQFNEK
jgi:hypothetical protein